MGIDKKTYFDRRSKKLQKKRRKTNRGTYRIYRNAGRKQLRDKKQGYDYIIKVPECFSFKGDLNNTVSFYKKTILQLEDAEIGSCFLIDTSSVTNVSIDAIMYLIAIMRNYKTSRKRLYEFFGNYPTDKRIKDIFIGSGFLKFVKSKSRRLPSTNEKKTIVSGRKNDPLVASSFCRFACENLDVTKGYTSTLYEVIIEMMSNVVYHAYKDDEYMVPEWYIYAETTDAGIHFLFLDTGEGIPKTVTKHSLYEKVISKIGAASESRLIKSALDGDFRTQTKLNNHGKGMPLINEFARDERVEQFQVISGKGHCWIKNDSGEMDYCDITNRLYGTIYSFILIRKKEVIV